jgi:hypothetical protein
VLPSPLVGPRIKLTVLEIALLLIGLPILGLCGVVTLTPVLTQNAIVVDYLWGDLPLIALVPSILQSAYKKLWATIAGFLVTAVVSGVVVQFLVGTITEATLIDLVGGVAVSALLIGLLLWLAEKLFAVSASSGRELTALSITVTVGTTILYLIAFGYIPIFIWLAPVLCVVGWVLGDCVRRGIIHWRDPGN